MLRLMGSRSYVQQQEQQQLLDTGDRLRMVHAAQLFHVAAPRRAMVTVKALSTAIFSQ